jgi:hypothetical protein
MPAPASCTDSQQGSSVVGTPLPLDVQLGGAGIGLAQRLSTHSRPGSHSTAVVQAAPAAPTGQVSTPLPPVVVPPLPVPVVDWFSTQTFSLLQVKPLQHILPAAAQELPREAQLDPVVEPPVPLPAVAPPVLLVVPPPLLPQATARAVTASKHPRRPTAIKFFMSCTPNPEEADFHGHALTVRFDPRICDQELLLSYRVDARRCKNFACVALSTCQWPSIETAWGFSGLGRFFARPARLATMERCSPPAWR